MATNPIQKWTVEDYLAFDDASDVKHEYMDGEIYAMSGGTESHSKIILNIGGALWQATKGSGCRTHSSEMRVKVAEKKYFYPDVSAVCGQAKFDDEKNITLINPTLIVEVTSASSESFDKGIKANFYRSLESLQHYLVVDQNQLYAQLSTRQDGGWFLQQFTLRTESIPLEALNVDLAMVDVYLDVEFDA